MALIVQNTDTTTGLVLDPGDDLVVNLGISVSDPVAAVTASSASGGYDIAVFGAIAGGANGISLNGGRNLVSVGPNGTVFSGGGGDGIALSTAISLVDFDANVVVNDGVIQAGSTGVAITAGSFHQVTNNGVITASVGVFIASLLAGSSHLVVNRGLIAAEQHGIRLVGTGNRVENTGTIVSNTIGVLFAADAGDSNTLTNAGVITAATAVLGQVGNDTVVNAARITGSVQLGEGSDVYDGSAGSVVQGTIDLGDGNDVARNAGHIDGNVALGGGQDNYDGRLGTVTGNVDLGDESDIARGGAGEEFFSGGSGEDFLFGFGGADVLDGNEGNDRLDGGAGLDTLAGGDGDDLFFVDDAGDDVGEQAGEGNDEARSTVSFTIFDVDVENLTLLGSAGISATGNAAANILRGNSGNNLLDGRGGADNLLGGAGNDTYVVDNAGDVVIENPGQGSDTVRAGVSFALSDADLENLVLLGAGAFNGAGNGRANVLTGNAGANTLDGLAGNDRLLGLGGDDDLIGGLGNDRLDGGIGADVLIGGRGADTLLGGAGADRFDFNAAIESPRGSGRDTVFFRRFDGDEINLASIDARADAGGNQAFRLIGAAAFGGLDGELRFAGGILQGDTNGDRIADFEIRVLGSLTMADIIL
jgi:Ca2+-binding RTX toxin-like protein